MTWKDGSACKPHEPMGEGLDSGLECFRPIAQLLGPHVHFPGVAGNSSPCSGDSRAGAGGIAGEGVHRTTCRFSFSSHGTPGKKLLFSEPQFSQL